MGDAEIGERDLEGDQHPGDPAEQRGEDDAGHRVGEREQHAGDDVGPHRAMLATAAATARDTPVASRAATAPSKKIQDE